MRRTSPLMIHSRREARNGKYTRDRDSRHRGRIHRSGAHLSTDYRRATLARAWPHAPRTRGAVRHLRGSGADGQFALLERRASDRRQRGKSLWASRGEVDVEAGRSAAHFAALNVLAVARQYLGSLDKVTRVVRLVV